MAPVDRPLRNERDEKGHPICPVCGKPVLPADVAARPDGFVTHAGCWDWARGAPRRQPAA